MRAAWITDPHLEHLRPDHLDAFCRDVSEVGPDVVLLGGDIAVARNVVAMLSTLDDALRRPIYFVLGNHDYYGSSISDVRAKVGAFVSGSRALRWLPAIGVARLTEETALIGHGGWADGRYGDYANHDLMLSDYRLIDDFRTLDHADRLRKLNALGDEAAARLAETLEEALRVSRRVVLLTHVPPFMEACWHEGRISTPEFLPHFSCKAVGDALTSAMRSHPDNELLVLCGHTHSAGEARILPNLLVRTGDAVYGQPRVQDVLTVE
ncbi:phosphoesterase [Candidatus Poribacteria bacterium]|jgi:3',5'-cyclic-AMP phosphodiesterase|nr:phosphoesterase [Candidatus Poribacteria bacterium]MBT5532877.1 phosphoesterase [Candidatus Poribacteria bacterium]MBT5710884.1 phosphoesterase [Candidatus Poribacteria bacterium]MBT7806893.1 phosphoesterase [Candidatus Poribacteria bacterium]